MKDIINGGVYGIDDVYITGANKVPPSFKDMYNQIQKFYHDLEYKSKNLNAIELAAYTHAEFVRISPFKKGNGRVARLLMNYQLMSNGFLPISIKKEERLSYFEALEQYVSNDNLQPFIDIILNLEEIQIDNYLNMEKSLE